MLRNGDDGSERGSLLWLLDHTRTPFGGRALRRWVAHPLRALPAIQERLDAVQEVVECAAGGPHTSPAAPARRENMILVCDTKSYYCTAMKTCRSVPPFVVFVACDS